MKKRRLLAWLMTLVMMVGLMPATALAEEPAYSDSVRNEVNDAVTITKSVTDLQNGNYEIAMDAYVTGKVETTQPDPLDIVLVLDVSGSMADKITVVSSEDYVRVGNVTTCPAWLKNYDWGEGVWDLLGQNYFNSFIAIDATTSGGEYYYSKDGNAPFYPITNVTYSVPTYTYTYKIDDNTTDTYTSKWSGAVPENIYKIAATETEVSKMNALQQAANAFITATAEKNAAITDTTKQHRISIVKFAGDNKDGVPAEGVTANDFYKSGQYQYNNSQVVNGLTAVDANGKATLTASINALKAAGATSADYGMKHAQTVLAGSNREKVVVFFTDGEPNHGNGFDTNVANATISAANALKTKNTTIFTVGVLKGADPSDTTTNINKYLHAVSSNYPNATSLNNMGTRAADSDYYKTATDTAGLTGIFKGIVEEMVPAIELNEEAVLKDVVSPQFKPVGDASSVKVYKVPAGGTGDTPTWGTPVELTSADGVTVAMNGKELTVTGFDYADDNNMVVKKDGTWQGHKLQLVFDVTVDETYTNWTAGENNYDTNSTAELGGVDAGIYVDGEIVTKANLADSPVVPLTAYEVTYDANGGTNPPEAVKQLEGKVVTVAGRDNMAYTGYVFEGWNTQADGKGTAYAPGAEVSQGMTLYAQWATDVWNKDNPGGNGGDGVADKYQVKVVYTAVNGTTADTAKVITIYDAADPTKYAEEGTVTIPGTTSTANSGYHFDKWAAAADENHAGWKVPTLSENTTLKAMESAVKGGTTYTFTATFVQDTPQATVTYTDGVDDEEVFKDQVYKEEVGANTPAYNGTLSREGYVFEGWTPAVTPTVTGDATYTATWAEDTWNKNNPEGGGGDGVADKYQVKVVYTTDENGQIVTGAKTVEILDLIDEDGKYVENGTVKATGSEAEAKTSGYFFKNWTTDVTGLDVSDEDATLAAQTFAATGKTTYTFTANFEQRFEVSYEWTGAPTGVTLPTGGTFAAGAPVTVDTTYVAGAKVVATKDAYDNVTANYVFSGWDKANFTMPAEDVTITGTWTLTPVDSQEYTKTVTYEWSGDVPSDVTLPTGGSYAKGATVPVATVTAPKGYTFSGWTTTDVTEDITDGSFVMPGANVKLTGVWAKTKESQIEIAKSVDKTTVTAGETVKYTIKLSNPLNEAVTVQVSDEFLKDATNIQVRYFDARNILSTSLGFTEWAPLQQENGVVTVTIPANYYEKVLWKETNTPGACYITYEYTTPNVGTTLVNEAEVVGGNSAKVTVVVEPPVAKYAVSYAYTGTVPANAPALPETVNYAEGDTVRVAAVPTLAGYTFSGWSKTGTFTMPNEAVEITGSWQIDTPDVEKRIVSVNGEKYNESDEVEIDDIITYEVKITNKADVAQNVTVTDTKFPGVFVYEIDDTNDIIKFVTGGLDVTDLPAKEGYVWTASADLTNIESVVKDVIKDIIADFSWEDLKDISKLTEKVKAQLEKIADSSDALTPDEIQIVDGKVTVEVPAKYTAEAMGQEVAVDGTTTIFYNYKVTVKDAIKGEVTNDVTVNNNNGGGNKEDGTVIDDVKEPTVSQVKKVAVHKAEPGVGDKIQYTIVIENTYSEELPDVVVEDTMFGNGATDIQVVEVEGLVPASPESATAEGDKIAVDIPKQTTFTVAELLDKAEIDLSELENINIEDILADLSNIPGMEDVNLGELSDWINASGAAAELAMNTPIDIPGYTIITYTYTVTEDDVTAKEIHNEVEVTGKTDDVIIKTEEDLIEDNGLKDVYKAAMPETFANEGQLIQYMVVLENDGAAETVTITDNLLDDAENVYITEVKGMIPGVAVDVTDEVVEDGENGTLEVTVPAEERIVDMPAVSTSIGNRFPEVVEGMLGVAATMTELDELLTEAGIDLDKVKEQLSKAQDGYDVPGYIILTYTYEATADDVKAGKIYNLAEADGKQGDATVEYDPFEAPADGTYNGEFHTMYEEAIVNKVNDVTGGSYTIDDVVSIDVYAGNDAATGRPEIGDGYAEDAIEDIIGEMLNHYTLLTDATEYTKGRDHWYTANAFDVIEEDDVDQIIITLNDGETVVVDEDYLRVVNDIQNVPINNGIDLVGLRDYVTKLGLTDLVNFMEDLELNKVTEIYLKFDVTFVVNGKEISKLAEIVEYGETVADPEYKGIKTWYTDEECTVEFDFNTEITKDTVLYAKYDEKGIIVEKDLVTTVPEGGFENGNTVEFEITVTNNSGADAYNLKVVEKPGKGLDGKGFYYEESKVEPKDPVTPEAPVEPATPAASAETPAALVEPATPAETPAETPAAPAAPAETPAAPAETPAAPAETPAAPAETPAAPAETPAAPAETPAAPAETPAAPAETPAAPAETPTTPDVQAVVEEGTTPATETADKPYLDGGNVVIPFLANGESITLTYKAEVVVSDDSEPEDFYNTVVVKVEDGEDAEDTNKDVVVKEDKPEPEKDASISIKKEIDENDLSPRRGEWVTYTITVKNNGNVTLTDIWVTEDPGDVFDDYEFRNAESPDGVNVILNYEDEDNKAYIDELGSDQKVILTFRAKVKDNASRGEDLYNYVEVETETEDGTVWADAEEKDGDVFVKKSGGGNGGNKKPIVAGDVEEILNTEDHFQYVQGYPDGTVGPERNITRAEATVIFFRLLQDHVRAELLTAENEFPDVNLEDWFNLGVSTMEAGGFVSGYEDGYFRPNGKITRAELATIISNFDDLEPATENKFADVEGHWAEKYVNSAAAKGWISGYDDGLFRPNQYITRAETMSMINRVLNRRVDEDGLHADAKQWRDNVKGQWYYYAVLEATNHHDYQRADVKDMENWTAINPNKVWEN